MPYTIAGTRFGSIAERSRAWRRWPWRANELDEIWTGSLPIEVNRSTRRYALRSTPAERIARKVEAVERAFFAEVQRTFRYADPAKWHPYQPGEIIRVEVEGGSTAPEARHNDGFLPPTPTRRAMPL